MTVTNLHIPVDHGSFAGHFPGLPILPGAVLLDEALHAIALERRLDLTQWQIASVKFLSPVRPGDALALEYSATNDSTIRFAIRTRSAIALSGTLGAVAAQRDAQHGD
jgi:3-hydroxyacyl-[acyl-carrier-protein] dehydratase